MSASKENIKPKLVLTESIRNELEEEFGDNLDNFSKEELLKKLNECKFVVAKKDGEDRIVIKRVLND